MKSTAKLQKMIDDGELVVAIGAHDALSAVLVERAGFNAIYVGSYATEAAFLGKPDLALMSKTERLMICRSIAKAVSVPIIADMEEGYGNAIAVADSVRDFEAVGLAGVNIDDEAIPCKCPFLPGIPRNELISVDEMCGKIKAAVDARTDRNFKIIARSDVIGTVPLEEYHRDNHLQKVVERSNAYALLTDADVVLDKGELGRLVAAAEANDLDIVSLMVRLHCETAWERLLIPAFVFFFQKLYPFPWVNDPARRSAAAAGGCLLVRRSALERAGGIVAIRDRIIDDCALAAAVKRGGAIWLGLAERSHSVRRYAHLADIWRMVTRSAYTQLEGSPLLLAGTVIGMALLYLGPPVALVGGALAAQPETVALGALGWLMMAFAMARRCGSMRSRGGVPLHSRWRRCFTPP